MKSLRLLSALLFVSALAVSVARADDKPAADKAKDDKACEKVCDCGKDKDGKACGVDKDCCCTGKKAEKKADTDKSMGESKK